MTGLMEKPMQFEVNGETVKLSGAMVKDYLVRGNGDVSDQELVMFMNLCKFQKLNPFLNEAYLIKFGSQPAQIIVSKEAFMKRAENHPKYEGFEAGIIVERKGELVEVEGAVKLTEDKLIGGWAKIYRSDRKKPITTRISLDEFSKGQATWKAMPLNMIRKSAIVNAQREAFPDTLGALYTEDDALTQTEPKDVTQHVQEEIKQYANTEVLDIPVNRETGEIIESEKEVLEQPAYEPEPVTSNGPGF
ncbi:phage recombination protein Bet [Sporosarcina sp. P37]|uniref:phage recombination protein Bet n=1 Tax=unclassified Sporosarcina TaxID=2647733 RepID=UPI000A17AC83|nr:MULTISPECIES: phage recombination protein Bet [unclassified Sporosarcina]ARK23277.1 phage recombination protein Bet [Sporosarcina sp. P37]PID19528.1 phage recombination protein Bet [Sporosarcina sp. P35]